MEKPDPRARDVGGAKLAAVVRLCHDLASATSIEQMFASVVDALVTDTGLRRASVLTFDDHGVMRFRAARGLSAEYRRQVDGHSPWSQDTTDARRILVDDVTTDPSTAELRPVFAAENIRALAFLPLIGGGRLLGKFMLYAEQTTRWEQVDLTFAGAAADVLASFILRERTQERLLQARKMESLGLLAGGIAHDFNNLLTAILGYVDLVRQETMRGTPARGYVDDLMATVEQASELTRQLLGFARPHVLSIECIDLGAFVAEAQPMLARLCGARVELRTALAARPAHIRANRTQLQQLLLNMVGNARDAMPEGGIVTVAVRGNGEVGSGGTVELEIADTGVGMDEATRRRVFEPLFTTKSPGRGTGLGLATCYAIITSLGGDIAVRSAPGRGSAFVIALPMAVGDEQGPAASVGAPPKATVLLVEDQDHVVKALCSALQAMHYRVLVAANGRRALEMLEREAVDVVVTDVVMPEMNGVELVQAMAQRWPDLPALLITGYVDGAHELPAGVPVLFKPFLPRELGHRIHELLSTRAARRDGAVG